MSLSSLHLYGFGSANGSLRRLTAFNGSPYFKFNKIILIGFFISYGASVFSEEYTWHTKYPSSQYGSSPTESCKNALDQVYGEGGYTDFHTVQRIPNGTSYKSVYSCFFRAIYYDGRPGDVLGTDAVLEGDTCPESEALDSENIKCRQTFFLPKQKGIPQQLSCPFKEPSAVAGDPINFAIGNVYESIQDYSNTTDRSLSFSRNYNSVDGLWRHSYSSHLILADTKATIVEADGREIDFLKQGSNYGTGSDGVSLLKSPNNIMTYYDNQNGYSIYGDDGRLNSHVFSDGNSYTIAYSQNDGLYVNGTVTTNSGKTLVFTEGDFNQPKLLVVDGLTVNYGYGSNFQLISVGKTIGDQTSTQQYTYDSTNKGLLTSVTDERGIKMATWTYDSVGRVLTNTTPGTQVSVAYADDGSVNVVNQLGKTTKYSFLNINGVKHVTAIDGEPSPNCPASNSTYAYDTNSGLLTQKVDAKGFITQYTYNDRGLETQRVEGSGSTQPRTTTTEWDLSRFLRTKVAGPTHTTVYTYDAQGRQLTQVTTSNSSQ